MNGCPFSGFENGYENGPRDESHLPTVAGPVGRSQNFTSANETVGRSAANRWLESFSTTHQHVYWNTCPTGTMTMSSGFTAILYV